MPAPDDSSLPTQQHHCQSQPLLPQRLLWQQWQQ
jgi:hypothetical protein